MPFPHRLALSRLPVLCLAVLMAASPVPGQETQAPSASDMSAPDMAAIEQAWKRGDYVTVREGLERLAREDATPLAQYRYGRVLYEGRGGPRDIAGAIDWLGRAVEQDHLEATTLLARILLTGVSLGIERDPVRAGQLLAGAAARGDREAQYYMGLLTSAGDGVAKDEAAAVNWFLAAAEKEHVEAQYALSRAYSKGAGVAANPEKTLLWLTRAAENGHAEAQFYLANAHDTGQGAVRSAGEALRWYRRAAEQGHIMAQRMLGTKYMQGEEVTQDIGEALRWLEPAARAGEPGAMTNLGYIYATGAGGVPVDDARALAWYERAAEAGIGRAMLVLGRFHETGRGTPQDMGRAMGFYRQALAAGEAQAAGQLARLQLDGKLDGLTAPHEAVTWMAQALRGGDSRAETWLVAQAEEGVRPAQTALALAWLERGDRTEEAAAWLERAAQDGDARAQAELGKLHVTGTGVPLDYETAHAWLNLAAAAGLGAAAEQRDTVAKLMTPEQIAAAQARARTLFEAVEARVPATQQTVRDEN